VVEGGGMTKVEHAEQTLYMELQDFFPDAYFVGVGKSLTNEIVLIVYLDTSCGDFPSLPGDWEGFRVVVKDLSSMIS